MSMLSDKLREIIHQKNLKMSSLAAICQIDRTVLYKYVGGERKISAKAFRQLKEGLRLSPEEEKELQGYYNIAEMGEEDYIRRLHTSEFLASFRRTAGKEPQDGPPAQGIAVREGVLHGSLGINRAVQSVLAAEMEKEGGTIRLMAQPEYDYLFRLLPVLAQKGSSCTVRQVFCLEGTEKDGDNRYNLKSLKAAVQALGADCRYEPYYYYDNVPAHFSNHNLLPYLVVTGDCAFQISSDVEDAVCYRGREYIAFFQKLFDGVVRESRPFCSKIRTIPENLAFYLQTVRDGEPPRYGCSGAPCLMPYLTRDMLERYINWSMPDADALMGQVLEYAQTLEKNWKGDHILIDYFTEEGLDYFCNTGCLWQLPGYACAPFHPHDRYEMLRRYIRQWSDSRVHLMFRAGMFKLPIEMELLVYRSGRAAFLQEYRSGGYIAFVLKEKSLCYCFEDLLACLEKSGGVYDQAETCAIIEKKMGALKTQF